MAHHLPSGVPPAGRVPNGAERGPRHRSERGGRSSVGRAPPLQGGGRGFEPPRLHQPPASDAASRDAPSALTDTTVERSEPRSSGATLRGDPLEVAHLLRRFGVATLPGGPAARVHLHNRILREFDDYFLIVTLRIAEEWHSLSGCAYLNQEIAECA